MVTVAYQQQREAMNIHIKLPSRGNHRAGTVVSGTPPSPTRLKLLQSSVRGAETDEGVLLTKYKSYADAHL